MAAKITVMGRGARNSVAGEDHSGKGSLIIVNELLWIHLFNPWFQRTAIRDH